MLFFVSYYHYSVFGWQRIIQTALDSLLYSWHWEQTSGHRECIRTRNLPNTNKSQFTTRRSTFRSTVWHWASCRGTPWCPYATKYPRFKYQHGILLWTTIILWISGYSSTLDGGGRWSLSRIGWFTCGERAAGTHRIGWLPIYGTELGSFSTYGSHNTEWATCLGLVLCHTKKLLWKAEIYMFDTGWICYLLCRKQKKGNQKDSKS